MEEKFQKMNSEVTLSIEDIPNIKNYNIIEKIEEGSSGDDKYKIEKDGSYYLLRVGSDVRAEKKYQEFSRLRAIEGKGIHTHRPVDFGLVNGNFYSIVTWVEGTPVMEVIKADLTKDYYELGRNIGAQLKLLHDALVADTQINWFEKMSKQAEKFLKYFHELGIDFAGSALAEEYIKKNLWLTKNRPMVYLHGDFHWNNCVVSKQKEIGIIDFSGNDIGDPWFEFGGMLWALEYSESFANGQIDGYFGEVPSEFYRLFKLYTALYALEHLSYSNGEVEDLKWRIANASRMLRLFGENFEEEVPLLRRSVPKES